MKKISLLTLVLPLISLGQTNNLGINTTSPKALLDINATSNSSSAGLVASSINNFPTINPTVEQNGMLVNYNGTNLTNGLYYWDDNNSNWQYIFQTSTIKNNLAKVSFVSTTGFQTIPSGSDTNWRKTTFNLINTPDPNFKISANGDIIMGDSGNYNVVFTGGVTQTAGSTNASNFEISIVKKDPITNAETTLKTSAISIPAPDVADRSSGTTISMNTNLSKNDIIIARTRKLGTTLTAASASTNYAIIFSKLSN